MNTRKHGSESSFHFQNRLKFTTRFVMQELKTANNILDIGDESRIGISLSEFYRCDYIHTIGDLDAEWKPTSIKEFDVVFCFEVLEHLLNPLLFLRTLKKYIGNETKVFISTPHRPCILRSKDVHWKEFSLEEFNYLLDLAGYKDITFKLEKFKKYPLDYFKGVRPLIRLFADYDGLHLINKESET